MLSVDQIEKLTPELREEIVMVEVLPPIHVSAESAYVVDDYPFGFRLRCQKRYWIEYKPGKVGGFRLVTQTSNPKRAGLVWNAPKKGTYTDILVMGFNAKGHVITDGFRVGENEETLDRFLAAYREGIGPEGLKIERIARAFARGMKNITVTVTVNGDGPRQTREEANEIVRKSALYELARMQPAG
jgi:hypothetical protein